MGETPPAEPGQAMPAPVDDRFEKIEAEQERQGGLLETILDKVSGGSGDPKTDPPQDETRADRADSIADQVKQAVKDVGAEQAAEAARAEHDAEHARLRGGTHEPEHPPRERQGGFKSKLQRAMFGAEPK